MTARHWPWLAIASSFLFSSYLFFGLTAEDAYIVYRYVENLYRHGALVFNAGDRINALTSPLHAGVLAALYAVTHESVLTNKLLGLLALLAAAGAIGWRYRHDGALMVFAVALVVLPSCVVLWTYGGLETPLLLLLVVVATLMTGQPAGGAVRVYWLCLLGGLGFLARHDSVLYFTPLALAALLREPAWRHRLASVVLGGALPLAWLAGALAYYGDILPTSFYTKTPQLTPAQALLNGKYILTWLVCAGLLPALGVWWLGVSRPLPERIGASLTACWPLYVGIALELAYGLSMATKHMMFSFRFFVPYIPAVAILLAESIRADQAATKAAGEGRWRAVALTFVLAASAGHAAFSWHVYAHSVNGPAPTGELRRTGARDFMGSFIDVLREQAEVIRQDWPQRTASAQRAPRIAVYAGGILPYSLPEAYIYENLASYRHGARVEFIEFAPSADYTVTIVPFFGTEEDLRRSGGDYQRIFTRDFVLEGMPSSYRVYYNAQPRTHTLCGQLNCVAAGARRP